MADVVLTGVREMVARLNAKPGQVRDACGEGLKRFGEKIMRESQDRYVPVRSGSLKESGRVGKPYRRGDEVRVKLSYGGKAKAYALTVHEYPSKHDPPSWAGGEVTFRVGGPKYLDIPLKIYGTQAGVDQYLVPAIRRALERGAAR